MAYKLTTPSEFCDECGNPVLRDIRGEHISIEGDNEYCKCEDTW